MPNTESNTNQHGNSVLKSELKDEEIIKALECCMNGNNCGGCCPYDDEDDTCEECTSKLTKDALDLINRQKAEIERLRNSESTYRSCYESLTNMYEEAKSEAIKEVLMTLDAEVESSNKYIREYDDSEVQKAYNQGLKKAYSIVKEMTE